MARFEAEVEATAFTIHINRKEAQQLSDIIYSHGSSTELNRLGVVLKQMLKPDTRYDESKA